jgi:hypothetical protein
LRNLSDFILILFEEENSFIATDAAAKHRSKHRDRNSYEHTNKAPQENFLEESIRIRYYFKTIGDANKLELFKFIEVYFVRRSDSRRLLNLPILYACFVAISLIARTNKRSYSL